MTLEITSILCPQCGTKLSAPPNFIAEYWCASETHWFCRCDACGWEGEIADIPQVSAVEASEDE